MNNHKLAELLETHSDVAEVAFFRATLDGRERSIAGITAQAFCNIVELRDLAWETLGDDVGVDVIALFGKLPSGDIGDAAGVDLDDLVLSSAQFAQPAGSVEAAVAELWCDVLSRTRVAVGDDFLDLGGDSLAVVELLARVWETFHVKIEYHDFVAATDLGTFAAVVEAASPAGSATGRP
jgi:acyl carrier protein